MIPRSNYLTMPTSFYIENNSEFCIEKFLEINKTYDNFFTQYLNRIQKLFTNLEEIETLKIIMKKLCINNYKINSKIYINNILFKSFGP